MPARHVPFVDGGLAPGVEGLPGDPGPRALAHERARDGRAADPLLAQLARRCERLHDGRRRNAVELDRIIRVLTAPWLDAPAQPMREEGR